jgi:hypothetical protein
MIINGLVIQSILLKGKGVFTTKPISKTTIIERSPVIVMSAQQRILLDKTLLHDYIFEWGINKDRCCMALGYVSLYNHSYNSNCEYFMDYEENFIEIKTVRRIEAGEELTINYNGDWNNSFKVWFDVM